MKKVEVLSYQLKAIQRLKFDFQHVKTDPDQQSTKGVPWKLSKNGLIANNLHVPNKGTDQLRGNREADQHLCFRYRVSTIIFFYFMNLKFPASSCLLWLYSSARVRPVRKPHCWFSQDVAVLCSAMLTRLVFHIFSPDD